MTSRCVTIFSSDLGFGGAQKVAITLANSFFEAGIKVKIIKLKEGSSQLQGLLNEDIHVTCLNGRLRSTLFFWINFLYQSKPGDILLSTLRYQNMVIGLASLFVPHCQARLIFREANTYRQNNKNIKTYFQSLLLKIAYSRADLIIANSNDTYQDISDYVSPKISKKVIVLNNPIVLEKSQNRIDQELMELTEKLSGKYVYLGVGRFEKQKNFEFLIEAFARMRASKPCALVLIGEGSMLDLYLREIERFNLRLGSHVFVLKPRLNIVPLFKMADQYCLTSKWEGFGNVVMEAALCNTPVLVNSCPGGASELVRKYRIGRVVTCQSPHEYAEEMTKNMIVDWDEFNNLYQVDFGIRNYLGAILGEGKYEV